MAVFAVSFRVGSEGDRQARYNSMVARINTIASGVTWDETTSFYVMKYAGSAAGLASDIYVNSDMNGNFDLVVVINLSEKEYATQGKISYASILASIMSSR